MHPAFIRAASLSCAWKTTRAISQEIGMYKRLPRDAYRGRESRIVQ